MHQAQVVTAALEFAIEKVLSFDEDSEQLLSPLVGKQCEIILHELPFPLVFNFHASGVEVSSVVEQSEDLSKSTAAQQKSQNQCSITLSLFIINELKDTSNITQLIRDNKLDFDGNLQIAQHMSALFNGLDIDIEEVLSSHIGDIAAHNTMQGVASFSKFIKRNHKLAMQALKDAMLDEKPIAVSAIIVENFIQEVSEVRDAQARLEARLAILETKAGKKQ